MKRQTFAWMVLLARVIQEAEERAPSRNAMNAPLRLRTA